MSTRAVDIAEAAKARWRRRNTRNNSARTGRDRGDGDVESDHTDRDCKGTGEREQRPRRARRAVHRASARAVSPMARSSVTRCRLATVPFPTDASGSLTDTGRDPRRSVRVGMPLRARAALRSTEPCLGDDGIEVDRPVAQHLRQVRLYAGGPSSSSTSPTSTNTVGRKCRASMASRSRASSEHAGAAARLIDAVAM